MRMNMRTFNTLFYTSMLCAFFILSELHVMAVSAVVQKVNMNGLAQRAVVVGCEPDELDALREAAAMLERASAVGHQSTRAQNREPWLRLSLEFNFDRSTPAIQSHVHGVFNAIHAQMLYIRRPEAEPADFNPIRIYCIDLERRCPGRRGRRDNRLTGYLGEDNSIILVRLSPCTLRPSYKLR